MSESRLCPRDVSKCDGHQYATTNRRAKHPPLVSNSPSPTHDPTIIIIGSRNSRAKCELREIKQGNKREHAIKPQTTQAKPVRHDVICKKD
jgi:hypothetical protein